MNDFQPQPPETNEFGKEAIAFAPENEGKQSSSS